MRRRIAALGCLLALAAGGCAPRPEEPEGGYCVYYSALSDRWTVSPLRGAAATPSLPWWTPCCPRRRPRASPPPSPRGCAC